MASEIGEREMDYDSDDDIGCAVIYYDRDSPRYAKPNGLQYCKSMADLAIDFYNQQNSKEYYVADLIRLDGVFTYTTNLYVRFTAKLDDDSDAVTFEASIVIRAGETTEIEYVRTVVDEVAI